MGSISQATAHIILIQIPMIHFKSLHFEASSLNPKALGREHQEVQEKAPEVRPDSEEDRGSIGLGFRV